MRPYKYIISGGGTGGHIFPAIAIANEIKAQDPAATIVFIGGRGKMEMEKVPQAGYPIHGLWISGFQRKKIMANLLFPLQLLVSFFQALFWWGYYRPDILIGTGGFASGPMLFVGNMMGSKTFLQEQNSFPGITNKLLAKKAHAIAVAYPEMSKYFPKTKVYLTGNPVRLSLLDVASCRPDAYPYFDLDPKKKTIAVMGGSLGAREINRLIMSQLDLFAQLDVQLLWQCGKLYYDTLQKCAAAGVKILPFVQNMEYFYAVADILISRAGATSISELCVVGKPTLLIPSPNVAENHQFHNANALAKREAAIVLEEAELSTHFAPVFSALVASEEQQQTLSENIRKLALPKATKTIVHYLKQIHAN